DNGRVRRVGEPTAGHASTSISRSMSFMSLNTRPVSGEITVQLEIVGEIRRHASLAVLVRSTEVERVVDGGFYENLQVGVDVYGASDPGFLSGRAAVGR